MLGSLAAYGLSRFSYRFGFMKNSDISFFFLSQLILPPVVLALPFLVLYKSLALLDTRIGLILLYTLTVLPIVIWIMRDQFGSIPTELEEAALVDGLSIWGAFCTIILPIALPGMVAAFILSLVLTWNEYFFAALLTSTNAKTLPVMVASQTGSQGINWWSMAALSFAAILPLIVIGIAAGALHHQGDGGGRGEVNQKGHGDILWICSMPVVVQAPRSLMPPGRSRAEGGSNPLCTRSRKGVEKRVRTRLRPALIRGWYAGPAWSRRSLRGGRAGPAP